MAKTFEGRQPYLELDEITTRVFCDSSPRGGHADAAYLFGETKDNEASSLEAGALLYRLGRIKKIMLPYGRPGHGYPGSAAWRKRLIKLGIPAKSILGLEPSKKFPPSTDAEAWGLVSEARKNKWRKIYVVAPPLHQLRAFISTVSAILKNKSGLLAYSFPGRAQNWEEHIVHSQGIQKGSRSTLLKAELQKIEKYYREGTLVSAEKALRYMDNRDRS